MPRVWVTASGLDPGDPSPYQRADHLAWSATSVTTMPVFFLICTCALWGLSFPVLKALHVEQGGRLPDADSVFLSAWIQFARFGLAALLLLPMVLRGSRLTSLEWKQGMWLAFFGGIGMALQADGLAYTDASKSAFLTQVYCIILPLVACVRRRRLPEMRVVVAVLLILAGASVLSGFRFDNPRIGRGELQTLALFTHPSRCSPRCMRCFFLLGFRASPESPTRTNRSPSNC